MKLLHAYMKCVHAYCEDLLSVLQCIQTYNANNQTKKTDWELCSAFQCGVVTIPLGTCDQGIINMNRNGNSAIFFSYVCNGKKIKELFASILNRKPASVKCVSSMIVVLNAKFVRLLAAKKTVRNEEARQECRVLLVKTHCRLTFIAVLTLHAKTSQFLYFPTI